MNETKIKAWAIEQVVAEREGRLAKWQIEKLDESGPWRAVAKEALRDDFLDFAGQVFDDAADTVLKLGETSDAKIVRLAAADLVGWLEKAIAEGVLDD